MKKVQVIIPCRGHSAFLGRAITSVKACGTEDLSIQVTVVCDGDNDAFQISRGYGVESILLDRSYGTYIAQNTGLSLSKSEWVTFCGADDEFGVNRISSMFDMAENLSWRAVLNTWHIKVDEIGMPIKLGAEALGGVFMYHSKMIESLGGFRSWMCSADTDMYNRAIRIGGRPMIVKQPHYRYRQHGDQLTHNPVTKIGSPVRFAYQEEMERSLDTYVDPEIGKIIDRSES